MPDLRRIFERFRRLRGLGRMLHRARADWRYPFCYLQGMMWRRDLLARGLDLGVVGPEQLGLKLDHYYIDSGWLLLSALKRLQIRPTDAIIDFGSGKGGALIAMSRFPFARIAGVEFDRELTDRSLANLQLLGLRDVSVFCSDAAEFTDLDDYNFFYFFNPFGEEIMSRVMQNIRDSLKRRPRDATLLYYFPKLSRLVTADSLFVYSTSYFDVISVYSHRSGTSAGTPDKPPAP